MNLQRQHFLLSYFKTPSDGPAESISRPSALQRDAQPTESLVDTLRRSFIVNLHDCRRGFHFCTIFLIAHVMLSAHRCSISRMAVQFQFRLFGSFGDPAEVVVRRFLPS